MVFKFAQELCELVFHVKQFNYPQDLCFT